MGHDETRCSREKRTIILFSSNLHKSENCTLTVYRSKPKVKVLLSTKHIGVRIEDNYKRISETNTFYNKTKFGVDVIDQMARKYSVKAGNFRWLLQIFFNIWVSKSKISRKELIFRQRSDASFLSLSTSEVRDSCQVSYCKKKMEAIIVVYIAKRSYAGSAQQKFSIFIKNVLNKYDYPTALILLLSFP